jgi:hypothetical protein
LNPGVLQKLQQVCFYLCDTRHTRQKKETNENKQDSALIFHRYASSFHFGTRRMIANQNGIGGNPGASALLDSQSAFSQTETARRRAELSRHPLLAVLFVQRSLFVCAILHTCSEQESQQVEIRSQSIRNAPTDIRLERPRASGPSLCFSAVWEPDSAPGRELKRKRRAQGEHEGVFREDVGDHGVDFFGACDLDEAGDEFPADAWRLGSGRD